MIQYAENGEDTFLFNYINEHKLPINNLIVDIGAFDGQFFSNSCAFIEMGWMGVLVEPHPESFAKLEKKYANNQNVKCFNNAVMLETGIYWLIDKEHPTHASVTDFVTTIETKGITFKNLYNEINDMIGILSIDAEGNDTMIARCALEVCKPQIIIIEANTFEEKEKQFDLLQNDYVWINEMGVNTIWILKEFSK